MSIVAIEWAFAQNVEVPSAKLVLLALADHADQAGQCYPSIGRIADRTALSERTIYRALEYLTGLGLIQPLPRDGRSSIYNLALDPCHHVTPPLTPCHPTPATVTETPATVTETPATVSPITVSNRQVTVKEPSARKRARQLPDDWQPDDGLLAWAKESAPHVDTTEETERFCDYYRSKGEPRKDWAASWRNWIRRARRDYAPAVARLSTPLDRKRARNHERINAALGRCEQAQAPEPAGDKPQLVLIDCRGKPSV